MSAYDRAKDQHLDHTKENPGPNCPLCSFYDWIDEKPEVSNEPSEWKKKIISKNLNKLKELEQDFKEYKLYDGNLRKKKKEYNKILSKLRNLGLELEEKNRKIIDGDEASGYSKNTV